MRREREAATQQLEEEAEVSSTGQGWAGPAEGCSWAGRLGKSPERVCAPEPAFSTPSPKGMWLWGLEIRTKEMCEGLRKMGWVGNLGFSLGLERQGVGGRMEQSCTVSVS